MAEEATGGINIEQASADMAADILGGDAPAKDDDAALDTAVDTAAAMASDKGNGKDAHATTDAIEALPVPQSWKKEMHEHWGKMPREAQAYYLEREKQMLDGITGYKTDAEFARPLKGVFAKYQDLLESQGLQAPQALDFLFNAHRQLSMGTPEQRMAYLERVAKTYGLTLPKAGVVTRPDGSVEQPAQTPPEVKAAIERMERIEAALSQEQAARLEAARAKAAADVEAFASDPKHPLFDECAEDIAKLIKAGETLESAYEKAVWANPVTRAKELARIQQADAAAAAEKAKEAARAAKKATSTNVRGRDTTRSPTESMATIANMDEVLRETMDEIKARH